MAPDKFLFNLAPYVVIVVAMMILAPVAFAKVGPDLGYQYRRVIYYRRLFSFRHRHPDGGPGQQ